MMDPWQMEDEQFWAALDTATLEDELQHSRQEELRASIRIHLGRPLTPAETAYVDSLPERARAAAEEIRRALLAQAAMQQLMAQALAPLLQAYSDWLAALKGWAPDLAPRTRPHTRPGRPQPQPRTLHLALAANARPVHRQRVARGGRIHASRRQ